MAKRKKVPTLRLGFHLAYAIGSLALAAVGLDALFWRPKLAAPQSIARLERVCFGEQGEQRFTYTQVAAHYGLEEDLMETTLGANSLDGAPARKDDPIPGDGCVLLALSPGARLPPQADR